MEEEARKQPAGRGRWFEVLSALGLAGLCLLVFRGARPTEYVLDSEAIVQQHPLLTPEHPWWEILRSSYWPDHNSGLYRPLTLLSYRVEKQALGFQEPGQHARTNLVLHVLCTLALWWLIHRCVRHPGAAFLAAACFAAHPVATEVVPNLVGRADALATLGTLGALLLWTSRPRGPGRAALAAAVWFGGLLSKESAVVFPALALLFDGVAGSREADVPVLRAVGQALRRRWAQYLLLVSVGVAWLALRAWVLSRCGPRLYNSISNPLVLAPWLPRCLTAVRIVASYVLLALWPRTLSADYSFDQVPGIGSPMEPAFLGSLSLVLLLVTGTWLLLRQRSLAGAGLAFFLLAILPMANLFLVIGTIQADRLLYLPLAGLALALAVAADGLLARCRHPAGRAGLGVVLAAVVAAEGLRTAQRNPVWNDSLSLARQTVRDAPRCGRARVTLVAQLLRRGPSPAGLQEALVLAEDAVHILERLEPIATVHARVSLGAVHLALAGPPVQGRDPAPEARRHLEQAAETLATAAAIEEAPNPLRTYWEERTRWSARAGRPLPGAFGTATIYVLEAQALLRLGRMREALPSLQKGLAVDPSSKDLRQMQSMVQSALAGQR